MWEGESARSLCGAEMGNSCLGGPGPLPHLPLSLSVCHFLSLPLSLGLDIPECESNS